MSDVDELPQEDTYDSGGSDIGHEDEEEIAESSIEEPELSDDESSEEEEEPENWSDEDPGEDGKSDDDEELDPNDYVSDNESTASPVEMRQIQKELDQVEAEDIAYEANDEEDIHNEQPRKRRRRIKQDVRIINAIIKEQKNTDLIIPKANMSRLIREIAQDYKIDLRFTADALEAIQTAAEDHIINTFKGANLVTISRGHQTIEPKDMRLVERIREDLD